MVSSRNSALWFAANAKYGSMLLAARGIGIHVNTLYAAASGNHVSAESRRKIEAAFNATLEELQAPVAGVAV